MFGLFHNSTTKNLAQRLQLSPLKMASFDSEILNFREDYSENFIVRPCAALKLHQRARQPRSLLLGIKPHMVKEEIA